jgi:hypothetical protein
MASRISSHRQVDDVVGVYIRALPGAHPADVLGLRAGLVPWVNRVDQVCLEAAAEDLALRGTRLTPPIVDGYIAFWAARGPRAARQRAPLREGTSRGCNGP